jgi:2-polyprenyl-6-methoxyphenol hydroxylase-like FAD-dependent oxidoreductase
MAATVFSQEVTGKHMHHIAIVGAGITGLCSALALATRGHQVTIFERDEAPPAGNADAAFFDWQRQGAGQFRHPHAFLGLMCNLLADNYPDLLEAFYEAGARRVGFQEMLTGEMKENYVAEPGDERLWILGCRRATIETVLRRYVEQKDSICIRNHTRVTGLVFEQGPILQLTGVAIEEEGAEKEFLADLVIDASGRTSRFPKWLSQAGCEIAEEKHDAEIVYFTRHYRLLPGQEEPPREGRGGAGDLGYLKFGLFPADNGAFAIILCLPVGEDNLRAAVRDGEKFDLMCRQIPGLQPWLTEERSEPTTEPFGIGDIHAVWRHFVSGNEQHQPLVSNFFTVGDAAVRTNPLYGRGCSTGILHAHLLADVLDEESDPIARAISFSERTETRLRPIYEASLREDQRGIRRATAAMEGHQMEEPASVGKWFRSAFSDAIGAATRNELHVLRGAMRTFHLLENPGDFLKDWRIRWTILKYMLKGRANNVSRRLAPGPDRAEMLTLVSE